MVWQFLKILNMESPSDLKFLLGKHPKELKTGTQTLVHQRSSQYSQAAKYGKFPDIRPMNKVWYRQDYSTRRINKVDTLF